MHPLHKRLLLLVFFVAGSAHAQTIEGIDSNGVPLQLQPSDFAVLEPAKGPEAGSFSWTFRTTTLIEPLSLVAPSTSPRGTIAPLSSGALLGELSAGLGISGGWDFGVGFGAHLYQWGPGNRAAAGADEGLVAFGARDPRLGGGFTVERGDMSFRPFLEVTLPLGSVQALAGERTARLEGGSAFQWISKFFTWSSELSFLYRGTSELSGTLWGPQLRVGTGVAAEVLPPLSVAAEVQASPVLSAQTNRSGAPGGKLIPAEAIASLRYQTDFWSLSTGCGTGLPLSTTSTENTDRGPVRGPSAPLFRAFIQFTAQK